MRALIFLFTLIGCLQMFAGINMGLKCEIWYLPLKSCSIQAIQHQDQTCLPTWTSLLKTTSTTPGKKDSKRHNNSITFLIFSSIEQLWSYNNSDIFLDCRCKLYSLERKCFSKMEKLKSTFEDHLHHGIPASDLLDKTVSFFSLKRALLLHTGYSRCSREILRLAPSPEQDVTPLFWCKRPSQTELNETSRALDLILCVNTSTSEEYSTLLALSLDFEPLNDFEMSLQKFTACLTVHVMHNSLWKPSCIAFTCYVFSLKSLLYFSLEEKFHLFLEMLDCALLSRTCSLENNISILKIQCIILILISWLFINHCVLLLFCKINTTLTSFICVLRFFYCFNKSLQWLIH